MNLFSYVKNNIFKYYFKLYETMTKSVIKPLTIEIEKELWEKFKDKIPRSKKLNDAVVELIKKEVEKK
jgi:hypothetical protein